MTRQEHLEWAKTRALEYVERSLRHGTNMREELLNAFTSMASDLSKHPELEKHKGIEIGMALIMMPGSPYLDNPQEMKRFIEGFN